MDLQDFESQLLYFDIKMSEQVEQLIQKAAQSYASGKAEPFLLEAYRLESENLSVLVALYRFYYYQHRHQDALKIADRVMDIVGPKIFFPPKWQAIQFSHLSQGIMVSFTMVRFYLLALKGAAYLNLRLSRISEGVAMLNKVIELDSKDRLGARSLLQAVGPAMVVDQKLATASVN